MNIAPKSSFTKLPDKDADHILNTKSTDQKYMLCPILSLEKEGMVMKMKLMRLPTRTGDWK